MRNRGILAAVVLALVLASAPLVAAPAIERGVDVFTTTANGKTFYDFAANPVPAGFFCKGSAAFTGRVPLRGLPIATEVPGQLRNGDTVIERLDDAVFDGSGVATTRIRFKALSLVSIEPIRTSCGAYHVYVTLAGQQPETTMRIRRASERGGSFRAPLAADVRLSFVPVKGRSTRKLELAGSVRFPGQPIPWSVRSGPGTRQIEPGLVDTNGDLVLDTHVSGSSGFAPGWSPDGVRAPKSCTLCEGERCHSDSGEQHCTGPVYACYPYHCP